MGEEYNIWDLEGVHVSISEDFLSKLNHLIFEKFKVKRVAYQSIFGNKLYTFTVFKNMLKPSYHAHQFIPLEFVTTLCEELNISKEELQKNILAYRSWGSVNSIKSPKLPIEITPVFDMIYAHNIGDGTVSKAKGRFPYFAYRQFNEFYRESYQKKIEFVFGNIKRKKETFLDNTRIRCPSVLSSLFFKHYNLDDRSFLSDTARISQKVFDKGKDSLLAVLVALIIDEGHIDSTQIAIGLKNGLLIDDLKKICDLLGYDASVCRGKGEYFGFDHLRIKRNGMKKLYEDYLELNNNYPVINLGIKGERIKKSFEISSRGIIRTKGNSNLIIEILKSENLSVNQIASRINMTRQGVRYHIHKLLNRGRVRILDKTKSNWTYGV